MTETDRVDFVAGRGIPSVIDAAACIVARPLEHREIIWNAIVLTDAGLVNGAHPNHGAPGCSTDGGIDVHHGKRVGAHMRR